MRRGLDFIYQVSAWLAALFMVGSLGIVLVGLLDRVVPLPWRGFDALAGYGVAGSAFMALAHTLKRGDHVRVTVLLHAVGPLQRRVLELLCLTVAVGLSAVLTYHAANMAWHSWEARASSAHPDRTLLWLPQTAMALGMAVFCVALIDEGCRAIDARTVKEVSSFESEKS